MLNLQISLSASIQLPVLDQPMMRIMTRKVLVKQATMVFYALNVTITTSEMVTSNVLDVRLVGRISS